MIIDCDRCAMRDIACDDCVVTALLESPAGSVAIDEGERAALGVLADSGLVPPLRLVPPAADRCRAAAPPDACTGT